MWKPVPLNETKGKLSEKWGEEEKVEKNQAKERPKEKQSQGGYIKLERKEMQRLKKPK